MSATPKPSRRPKAKSTSAATTGWATKWVILTGVLCLAAGIFVGGWFFRWDPVLEDASLQSKLDSALESITRESDAHKVTRQKLFEANNELNDLKSRPAQSLTKAQADEIQAELDRQLGVAADIESLLAQAKGQIETLRTSDEGKAVVAYEVTSPVTGSAERPYLDRFDEARKAVENTVDIAAYKSVLEAFKAVYVEGEVVDVDKLVAERKLFDDGAETGDLTFIAERLAIRKDRLQKAVSNLDGVVTWAKAKVAADGAPEGQTLAQLETKVENWSVLQEAEAARKRQEVSDYVATVNANWEKTYRYWYSLRRLRDHLRKPLDLGAMMVSDATTTTAEVPLNGEWVTITVPTRQAMIASLGSRLSRLGRGPQADRERELLQILVDGIKKEGDALAEDGYRVFLGTVLNGIQGSAAQEPWLKGVTVPE